MDHSDAGLRLMEDMQEWASCGERNYFKYDRFFCKRSLRPQEYVLGYNGIYTPPLGKERLQNEADCLRFIRKTTNIPVRQVEFAFESDGAFYLIMSYENGPDLGELEEQDKQPYLDELKVYLNELHSLRSSKLGGPGGLVVPPTRIMAQSQKEGWQLTSSAATGSEEYLFCHNDISEHNIIVDQEQGRIKAIIDWEYGGFWPSYFEGPVYTRTGLNQWRLNDSPENIARMEALARSHSEQNKCIT